MWPHTIMVLPLHGVICKRDRIRFAQWLSNPVDRKQTVFLGGVAVTDVPHTYFASSCLYIQLIICQ